MTDQIRSLQGLFPTKRGQVLYCISQGKNLTKSDIKSFTELSMSTVLSSVDKLCAEGLITCVEEKRKEGGKPRSVINVKEDKYVFGVTYKSGVLTAVRVNLKGEIEEESEIRILENGSSPARYVLSLLAEIGKKGSRPLAVGLSMNTADPARFFAELEKECKAPVYATSNAGAAVLVCVSQCGEFPICAIGVGAKVKCAILQDGLRVADVGRLHSPVLVGKSQEYEQVLSAPQVERRLSEKDFYDCFYFDGARFREAEDLRSYSEVIQGAITSLCDQVAALTSPKRLYIFGDYITDSFFDRIKSHSAYSDKPQLFRADPRKLALGAAYYALAEEVFSR